MLKRLDTCYKLVIVSLILTISVSMGDTVTLVVELGLSGLLSYYIQVELCHTVLVTKMYMFPMYGVTMVQSS